MKNSKYIVSLFSSISLLLSISAYAENSGLVFPPDENTKRLEYPPVNTQQQRQMANFPTQRNFSQMPTMPRQQPNMMLPPQQQQMFPMPNRNNQYNQNRGFPFGNNSFGNFPNFGNGFNGSNFNPFSGNNMPFGNNSGNNFNPFSGNNMPFGNNSGNNFNPFSGGNYPFGNNSGNPMSNMFGNNNNNSMPFFGNTRDKNRKKAWGDERNIWPDFYTDFTDDAWDSMSSGPRDLGRMPGGWRFPHISTPDPVTVSDAITNQFPPIAEEAGNMMDISEWGVFDNQ